MASPTFFASFSIKFAALSLVHDPPNKSNMVSEQECLDAVAAMPRARYLQLPGQPHPLEACNAAVLAEAVRGFFGAS